MWVDICAERTPDGEDRGRLAQALLGLLVRGDMLSFRLAEHAKDHARLKHTCWQYIAERNNGLCVHVKCAWTPTNMSSSTAEKRSAQVSTM